MTPLPGVFVRRTDYVAPEPLDSNEAGPASSFVAWLAAERRCH